MKEKQRSERDKSISKIIEQREMKIEALKKILSAFNDEKKQGESNTKSQKR